MLLGGSARVSKGCKSGVWLQLSNAVCERLGRLVRVVRVFRVLRFFADLRIMVMGILSCIDATSLAALCPAGLVHLAP